MPNNWNEQIDQLIIAASTCLSQNDHSVIMALINDARLAKWRERLLTELSEPATLRSVIQFFFEQSRLGWQREEQQLTAVNRSTAVVKLQEVLANYFSEEEIKTLCFNLGVDYDALPAVGKNYKIRELVRDQENLQALEALREAIIGLRPNLAVPLNALLLDWPKETILPLTLFFQAAQKHFDFEKACQDTLSKLEKALIEAVQTQPIDLSSFDKIMEKLEEKRLTLFVGADLPEGLTGVPARKAMADELARRENLPSGRALDWVMQQVMAQGNKWEITDFLLSQLNYSSLKPQLFHKQIASLVQAYKIETVITTAYDNLLQRAFEAQNIAINRIVNDEDTTFAQPGRPTFIKLFGDWQQIASLVLTQQDLNALSHGRKNPELLTQVKQNLRRKAVLFLGQDLEDLFILNLLDEFAGKRFQIPSYALWSGLSESEMRSLSGNRGITVLHSEPTTFLTELLKRRAL